MDSIGFGEYTMSADAYDQALADQPVANLTGVPMKGVGFEISHMIRWNKDGKTTSTSFEGLKPTTGASLIIGNVPPATVRVANNAEFLQHLSEAQLAMYAEPIAKSL